MPVYPSGPEKWIVRLYHKGKAHTWRVNGKKSEAVAFEARKKVELEAQSPVADLRTVPLFSDFCVGRYKQHAKMHLRATTWSARKYQLATLIEHFGKMKLTEIGPDAVEAFKLRRLEKVRVITVNNDLAVLQAVLAYAKEMRIPIAQFDLKFLPLKRKNRVIAWSTDEVARLYESVQQKAPALLSIVVFLANTGCRVSEALNLRWSNIDLSRRLVCLTPTDEWLTKSGHAREIPIGDALLPILGGPRTSSKYVFPNKWDRPYARWPKTAFNRARVAAGLRGGPHTLRHTYASHFLQSTPDLHLLARIMGHSDSRVTELYAHLLPDHLARGRNAVSFPLPPAK